MINIIIYILFVHWIADFVCQSSKTAKNKYNNIHILFEHIAIYFSVMFILMLIFTVNIKTDKLILWCLVNGSLHLVVDFFTSKVTHYLYERKNIHMFFVVIGLDQLLHYICLLTTLDILISK